MYFTLTRKHIYTPGPVKMTAETLKLGSVQTPYFRNQDFSNVLLQCESMLLKAANAPSGSRCIFLTASGTAAMEAAIINLLSPANAVAVINGGSFGQRFVEICNLHKIPVQEVKVDRDPLTDGKKLAHIEGVEALLINGHETSIGHCYDLQATGDWCNKNNILHVVDAISLFVTDRLDMVAQNIDVLIVSSHKGLALPPGLSIIILSPKAVARVHPSGSYYMDFGTHLRDGERGQTPFTPAISIVLQLHQRLNELISLGLNNEWNRVADLAKYFRNGINKLPLKPFSSNMPNAMTALEVGSGRNASQVVQMLDEMFDCVVAPNGGLLKDKIFRVSHMGALEKSDMDRLITAMTSILGDDK